MIPSEDRGASRIMQTLGVEVFWNAGGNISIQQAQDGTIVAFTEDEAHVVLRGLAHELGYRVVKLEGQDYAG